MFSFSVGLKGEHEASVPTDNRTAVHSLPQAGKVQKAAFRAVFLPQRVVGKEEVSYAGLEHSVWL